MNIDKTDLQQLIHQYSIEIVPKTLRQIGDIRPWLAPGTEVYVPNLRGHKISDTIDACAQLQSQHMQAVPHLALRNIASEDELRHTLDRITALDIRRILVLAGGAKEPLGPYGSVKDLMKTGILQTYPFEHIGFAGHPEGSPEIPPDEQEAAEAQKQGYALTYPHDYYLTTQFCFQIAPITAWLDRLRARDITLPVHLGIPGVASTTSLIRHAQACGIGQSINFLWRNGRNIRRLMGLSTPDKLLADLAAYRKTQPENAIRKLHFYPLGGFETTINWLRAIEAGNITLTDEGFITQV